MQGDAVLKHKSHWKISNKERNGKTTGLAYRKSGLSRQRDVDQGACSPEVRDPAKEACVGRREQMRTGQPKNVWLTFALRSRPHDG